MFNFIKEIFMPLLKGKAKKVISRNIRAMVKAGHPVKKASAADYRKAGKSQRKRSKKS